MDARDEKLLSRFESLAQATQAAAAAREAAAAPAAPQPVAPPEPVPVASPPPAAVEDPLRGPGARGTRMVAGLS